MAALSAGRDARPVGHAEIWLRSVANGEAFARAVARGVWSKVRRCWSSYRRNALGQADALLTPHFLYKNLDADATRRCAAYRSLFNPQTDPTELQATCSATETGTILGSDRFKENIETTLKRRIARLPHGGDRKNEVFRDQHKNI